MDDAEAMGNDLDPVLCTVGPATAHRRPHAIQLLGRLFPTDLPSPAGPTCRLSATELLPFRERVQDGIGMPGAMAAVARPGRLARIGHHRGPHRVGLDVPQNDEQVVAVLDDRRSEAALPDVAAGSLSPVVPPGVSDGQGLEDAADRLPGGRLEKQMKMVGHQAVAEERERVPCLGAGEIAKEHIPFAVGAEDTGPPRHFSLSFLRFSIVTNYCTYILYLLMITKANANIVKRCDDVPQKLRFSPNAGFAIRPSSPILMRWPWPRTLARLFPRLIAW